MPFEDEIAIICNEEGKLIGLPLNRAIYAEPEKVEMSYNELKKRFREAEEKGKEHLKGYITFTSDSFTEPYSEESRTYVVSSNNKAFIPNMGGYSIELCGGTHLDNTAKVGPFRIESEGSVASGVRRIEAITGKACLADMEQTRQRVYNACAILKTKPNELANKLESQIEEIKTLKRAIESYKAKETAGEVDRYLFGAHVVGGTQVITANVPDADANKLRQIGDSLRDKKSDLVAVLSAVNDGKITFLAVCGKDAIAKGIKAGELVKLVCTTCGGSGGGKPDSAMGGGKDLLKLDDALAQVDNFVASKLS